MDKSRYIVAVKRDYRQSAPANWVDLLRELEGVTVVGVTASRVQIEADPEALGRVRERLGQFAHVEPLVPHHPVAATRPS